MPDIQYFSYPSTSTPRFSIIIPTWNNLAFVKLCVESIRKHAAFDQQIVLHINDGHDGTKAWAEAEQLDHTWSKDNVGICWAVNAAYGLCRADYILYMNDDMYVCPGWDTYLMQEIESIDHHQFFLSATLIEPKAGTNACVIAPHDFGSDPENFREDDLLEQFAQLRKEDWSGSTWPPNVVHRTLWEQVGGYSVEFSPGLYSDPDFAMKLWQAGVRIFKGISASRVYHFQSKSIHRIQKNNGRQQFARKWNIPASFLYQKFLRMGQPWTGELSELSEGNALRIARLKAWWQSVKG